MRLERLQHNGSDIISLDWLHWLRNMSCEHVRKDRADVFRLERLSDLFLRRLGGSNRILNNSANLISRNRFSRLHRWLVLRKRVGDDLPDLLWDHRFGYGHRNRRDL